MPQKFERSFIGNVLGDGLGTFVVVTRVVVFAVLARAHVVPTVRTFITARYFVLHLSYLPA